MTGTGPLPRGFAVAVDPSLRHVGPSTVVGGTPMRLLRLTEAGTRALAELRRGPLSSPAAAILARRLTDAGLAHPRPPRLAAPADVTVIIPVRDRAASLDRCLDGLGTAHPVIVVDDGSLDPESITGVATRHRARVVRRTVSGGPGPARNTGLLVAATEFVAFLDSDCVPAADWITRLAPHLADPLVAAVAPRIVALPATTSAGRYAASRGSLDLGPSEARVLPGSRVAYLPTAALVVRRSALAVGADGAVFDPDLRYGEDVDLIWRLHERGWRIRYDPSVEVAHDEPRTWPALLLRRLRYGTSAAPLDRRHPGSVAPLVLLPWPAITVGAALGRRPRLAAVGFAGSVIVTARALHRVGAPVHVAVPVAASAVHQTWLGLGRFATQFASPLLIAAVVAPRRSGAPTRWRRIAAGSLLLGGPVRSWVGSPRELDPARYVAGHVADDVAYGCGVGVGCVRERRFTAVRPRIVAGPVRGGTSQTGKGS